jgi:hypothetical protein
MFLFPITNILSVGPTEPIIHWVVGAVSPWQKWAGYEANQFSQSSAKVKKEKTIPPLPHTLIWHADGQCYLYFVNKSKNSHPLMRVEELR